ncbi:hypothetical protein D3C74_388790 [compost metagenome]
MISPVRYSGRSARNTQASTNMKAGARTQLITKEVIISFLSASTRPVSLYLTLAKTGYIITSRPMAMGTDTPETVKRSSSSPSCGKIRPRPRPAAMASRIHRAR